MKQRLLNRLTFVVLFMGFFSGYAAADFRIGNVGWAAVEAVLATVFWLWAWALWKRVQP